MAYSTAIAAEVHGKLAGLRRALRGRLFGEGLAWVIVALVGAVFVTLGIDLTLRLKRTYRIVMACTAMGAIMWTVWREILAPLLAPMGAEDLALLVERRHKQLGDRLISALQFVRSGGAAPNESPAMVDATVRQANALAAPLDLGGIVERNDLKRVGAIAACTIVLLTGFSIWQSRLMWPWLQRNIAFADVDYPQDTYLEVKGGPHFTLLRGTDLEVIIRTERRSTVTPPYVTLHAFYPSLRKGGDDGWTEGQADLVGKDAEGRDFYLIAFPRVSEEFSFYVTGGDDRRVGEGDTDRHHKVRLIDPPDLKSLTFWAKFPDYIELAEGPVPDSLGTVTVPAGTALTVSATATKDIASMRILLNDAPVPDAEFTLAPIGGRPGQAGRRIVWKHKFDVARTKSAKTAPRSVDFALAFELTDIDGYTNVCGHKKINVQFDRRPVVKTRRRITILGDMATAEAIIPLASEFVDDHDLIAARAEVAVTGKTVDLPHPNVTLRKPGQRRVIRRRSVKHEVDLHAYGLVAGDEVTITVAAEDSLPAFLGGPGVGRTGGVTIRIVKPEKVQEKLVESTRRTIIEFVQAIALQQSVRDSVQSAGLMLSGGQGLDAAAAKLVLSANVQQAVTPECKKVADTVQDILFARICNRLGSEEGHENVRRKIIRPLRELADPLAETAQALKRTAGVEDPDKLQEQIIAIGETQDAIINAMNGILNEMEKDSTRQYIINRWSLIVDWSKDQLKGIKKRSDAQTNTVFDKKKDKKDDKKDDKKKDGN